MMLYLWQRTTLRHYIQPNPRAIHATWPGKHYILQIIFYITKKRAERLTFRADKQC